MTNHKYTASDRIRSLKRNLLSLCIAAAIRYPGA